MERVAVTLVQGVGEEVAQTLAEGVPEGEKL